MSRFITIREQLANNQFLKLVDNEVNIEKQNKSVNTSSTMVDLECLDCGKEFHVRPKTEYCEDKKCRAQQKLRDKKPKEEKKKEEETPTNNNSDMKKVLEILMQHTTFIQELKNDNKTLETKFEKMRIDCFPAPEDVIKEWFGGANEEAEYNENEIEINAEREYKFSKYKKSANYLMKTLKPEGVYENVIMNSDTIYEFNCSVCIGRVFMSLSSIHDYTKCPNCDKECDFNNKKHQKITINRLELPIVFL